MSIFITGDTHGDIDFHKLNTDNFPMQKTMEWRKDFMIICGDFGGVWNDEKFNKYIQDWYSKKPWITLFCDGNHENHDLLSTYPVTEWCGGKVHLIRPNIIHLMRGQVYIIEGKKFFVMGGAASHDKIYRKEGRDWWANEMPSDEEYEEALENLAAHDYKVDYIITHCAPDHVQDIISRGWYDHDKLTNFLQIVSEDTTFDKWYFGHYHDDRIIENKYELVYNDIIQLM